MAKAFQSAELQAKHDEKVKKWKGLRNKQKRVHAAKEKVEINKQMGELESEIEEIEKQGAGTVKNLLKALKESSN